ncbi:MAG TPA: hypothetical protein VMT46_07540 [Anaerolineaceae bacterium]|nr:hypothetical protein [Anaerolineaceae bacterium]
MANNPQSQYLNTAVRSLELEGLRLAWLVKPRPDGPFREKTNIIESKFGLPVGQIKTKIREVKTHIQNSHFKEAWEAYTFLKNEQIPLVSSELLSVLGGLYAEQQKLDNICATIDKVDDRELFFSQLANELLDDLKGRSDWAWSSVLIVGEERFGRVEADIIRLRFPACDLWNLPFSAHEYGYLIAYRQPPDGFKTICNRVETLFKPDQFNKVFTDETCLLPELFDHWKRYSGLPDADRPEYAEKNRMALDHLVRRQVDHLCRLFADAFATLLLGPAYIYALLHLAFVSNERLFHPTSEMPSFVQRFVVSLETLSWMNREPPAAIETGTLKVPFLPFKNEIQMDPGKGTRSGFFPTCWKAALDLAGVGDQDCYDETKKDLEPWLNQMKKAFWEHPRYSSELGIGKTYLRWKYAKDLEKELISISPDPIRVEREDVDDIRENLLPILLNAAWSASFQNPDQLDRIEEKAIRLLLGDIKIEEAEGRTFSLGSQRPDPSRQQQFYLEEISKGLVKARAFGLQRDFEALAKQGDLQEIDRRLGEQILEKIFKYPEAVDAYKALFPNPV